jgi:hypothetical protein
MKLTMVVSMSGCLGGFGFRLITAWRSRFGKLAFSGRE